MSGRVAKRQGATQRAEARRAAAVESIPSGVRFRITPFRVVAGRAREGPAGSLMVPGLLQAGFQRNPLLRSTNLSSSATEIFPLAGRPLAR